jgi:hypothetical protein
MRIREATTEEITLLDGVISTYHGDLVRSDVKVKLLFVGSKLDENGDPKGPALKMHGVACAAQIKVQKNIDKYLTGYHAVVRVDMDMWDDYNENRRKALLDHELSHLVVVKDQNGNVKMDEEGNIKIKCRPDDYTINGFYHLIQRHAGDAIEALSLGITAQNVRQVAPNAAQAIFSGTSTIGTGSAGPQGRTGPVGSSGAPINAAATTASYTETVATAGSPMWQALAGIPTTRVSGTATAPVTPRISLPSTLSQQ